MTVTHTSSAYTDEMAVQIIEQYVERTPPRFGEAVTFEVRTASMMEMIVELRHNYHDASIRAAVQAVDHMYKAVCISKRLQGEGTPEAGKQEEFRLSQSDHWQNWRKAAAAAMPPPVITIQEGLVPYTKLADVSSHRNESNLLCTDVSVMGVDAQQLIVDKVHASEVGWINVEEYVDPKSQGIIIDKHYVDMQTILGEEISDTAKPGIARRIAIRVRVPHVGTYTHGDRLRVYGFYEPDEQGKSHIKSAYIDARHIERLPGGQDAELTEEEITALRTAASADPEAYIHTLTSSIAPDIIGNESQKIVVMLAALKGQIHGDSRSNLHVMLMDSPGSGKSELLKWIANVLPDAVYVDAPNATAQGLLYGQEEYDGRKILHAGAGLRNKLLMLDEMDKMSPAERKKLNSAIEQQIASYHKVPFMMSQRLDLGLIAAANPHGERWIDDRPISQNTRSIEPALISRCIITRMDVMDSVGRLIDSITTDERRDAADDLYTPRQIAGIINYCSGLRPAYTAESRKTLKAYLEKFRSIQQSEHADLSIDTRKEIDVVRLASAAAKLLCRETVDKDSIELGIRVYQACLKSVGINTEAPTVNLKLAAEPRDMAFWDIFDNLANADGEVREVDLLKNMTDSTKWESDAKAAYYVRGMYERHAQIYQPRDGWYRRVA